MSDPDILTLPRLGETMEEGKLVAWLVEAGVPFRRGEIIAEVETDKTTVEVPALADGTLAEILVGEGETVEVGTPIARLAPSPSPAGKPKIRKPKTRKISEPKEPETGSFPASQRLRASPAARRLAESSGIALASLTGTGRRGRIQGDDVRRTMDGAPLPQVSEAGSGGGIPIVLLHGLGADAESLLNLQTGLAPFRRVLIPDLTQSAGIRSMVTTVRASLEGAGIARAHLVGHSLGGTIAVMTALEHSGSVASLTLLAPAGLGGVPNARLLHRYVAARQADELRLILEQFFGPDHEVPDSLVGYMASQRRDPAFVAPLEGQLNEMLQGIDGLAEVGALKISVRVVWGSEDRVLPPPAPLALPGRIAMHLYAGAGHLLHLEIADEVRQLVLQTIGEY